MCKERKKKEAEREKETCIRIVLRRCVAFCVEEREEIREGER